MTTKFQKITPEVEEILQESVFRCAFKIKKTHRKACSYLPAHVALATLRAATIGLVKDIEDELRELEGISAPQIAEAIAVSDRMAEKFLAEIRQKKAESKAMRAAQNQAIEAVKATLMQAAGVPQESKSKKGFFPDA
ncbi:MAG TPA: hypothetical protein VFH83_05355 [Spirochaetia bacterium]|nr:hypothetical protein [Spirochaetia bacterium]